MMFYLLRFTFVSADLHFCSTLGYGAFRVGCPNLVQLFIVFAQ